MGRPRKQEIELTEAERRELVARFRLLERQADSLRAEHLGPIEAALAPACPGAEP